MLLEAGISPFAMIVTTPHGPKIIVNQQFSQWNSGFQSFELFPSLLCMVMETENGLTCDKASLTVTKPNALSATKDLPSLFSLMPFCQKRLMIACGDFEKITQYRQFSGNG
jgi:hypothetical protein